MHRNLCGATLAALALMLVSCGSESPFSSLDREALQTAATTCTFTTIDTTMTLDGDCTTDETILVPDGFTLDGSGHTITAVDPPADHFRGAVVANGGSSIHVVDLTVTAAGLANVCETGADRLRGIMLEGASGSITHSTVVGINKGASGCQEGNAIEVRNAPFDGTHPNTVTVEVAHNLVDDYQKTGIVANGDVSVSIHQNDVGASATQANLAANSVQLGFGALGSLQRNQIEGNQWLGTSAFAGTAILTFAADGPDVSKNLIGGNSDIGILHDSNNGSLDNNKVFDDGADHPNSCCDVGIWNAGEGNSITNNKIRGFDEPYVGVEDGNNKALPGGPIS